MRLDTMLEASPSTAASTSSASNDSSDLAALNGASSNANVKLDLDLDLAAAERRIAESVSQELDYWEKLVFSFDMERDPGRGGPQQPDPSSNTGSRGKRRREEAQASAASSFVTTSAPSSSGAGPSHQQPSGSRHPHNPQFPHIAPNPVLPGQPPNPQAQQYNQLAGLDPYTLAHLAALSALQQGQQGQQHAPGQQPGNVQDPAAVLRQLQSLMYPYGNSGHASPGRGSSLQGVAPGAPQLQRFPSASFNRPGAQQHHVHPMQPSLSESSGQRWPPQVSSMNPLPFPMPPIDPALANQLSQLSQSFLPNTYGQQGPHAQTPGAGPSAGGSRARSRSTTSSGSPTPVSPTGSRAQQFMDEASISEDKRRRNTLASARFRIKKKHKTLALERSVVELEARADDLEREASELRRENGWLKEMLIMKGRSVRAQAAAAKVALEEAAEEEEEEEEEEEAISEEEEDEDHNDRKDPEDEPDIKGKGKAKAT